MILAKEMAVQSLETYYDEFYFLLLVMGLTLLRKDTLLIFDSINFLIAANFNFGRSL